MIESLAFVILYVASILLLRKAFSYVCLRRLVLRVARPQDNRYVKKAVYLQINSFLDRNFSFLNSVIIAAIFALFHYLFFLSVQIYEGNDRTLEFRMLWFCFYQLSIFLAYYLRPTYKFSDNSSKSFNLLGFFFIFCTLYFFSFASLQKTAGVEWVQKLVHICFFIVGLLFLPVLREIFNQYSPHKFWNRLQTKTNELLWVHYLLTNLILGLWGAPVLSIVGVGAIALVMLCAFDLMNFSGAKKYVHFTENYTSRTVLALGILSFVVFWIGLL